MASNPGSRRRLGPPCGHSSVGGVGAEIAATITERCFHHLEAAPGRVTGHNIPYPVAKLEKHHLPDLDRILDGVDRVLGRVPRLSEAAR